MRQTRKQQRESDAASVRGDAWTMAETAIRFESMNLESAEHFRRMANHELAVSGRLDAGADLRVIEIEPNGDPYGGGYTGTETKDAGGTWFYRGDAGNQPREWWRREARRRRAVLRVRS